MPLSDGETALQSMIQTAEGILAVVLIDSFHPGAQTMADRVQELVRELGGLQVLILDLAPYRDWAMDYDVFGTPAVLLFQRGRLKRRILGIVEEERLREMLNS